jgi:hypothetical protein
MIIEQTVEIPANHRLIPDLPLPENIPPGPARVVATIVPEHGQYATLSEEDARRQREEAVKKDPRVQEILRAGAAQAEARASGLSGGSLKPWYGILANSKAWGKELDTVAEIRKLRDEWADPWENSRKEDEGRNG